MAVAFSYTETYILKLLKEVTDPEIPVLNVVEMGIVREVRIDGSNKVTVRITPTYSGCPAMNAIENDVKNRLIDAGIPDAEVVLDFKETWTTDWLSEEACKKLKEYGIAPPEKTQTEADFFTQVKKTTVVPCPFCDSLNTKLQSQFGSTACKAQYFCNDCTQPFEHFKCI